MITCRKVRAPTPTKSRTPGSFTRGTTIIRALIAAVPVLFDSGNPANYILQSGGARPSTLPDDTVVDLPAPSGFYYSYKATGSGVTETSVGTIVTTGTGINFFTVHAFLIDIETSIVGWMQ